VENNVEKIIRMLTAMMAMLALSPEKRNEGELAKTLKDANDYLATDEAKGALDVGKARAELAQVRKDLDAQADAVRKFQRLGLSVRDNAVLIPGGLSARKEMLADGRCFMTDDTARRFAGFMAERSLSLLGRGEDCPPFVKAIADAVKADMDPGTPGAGGYLIPDEFRPEIIRNVEAEGVLFPLCRRIPLLTLGTTKIPKRTGGLTAYWTSPAAAPTRTAPTFELVSLTPEKLMVLLAYPNEFNRSSLLVDLGNFLGMEIVHAMAKSIDDALVNGDGSSDYGGITGILQSAHIAAVVPAAAADHDTLTEITGTDISEIVGNLPVAYALAEARWGMSLSVLGYMRSLRTTADLNAPPLFRRGGDGLPATIDDFPFTVCPRMPAAGTITTAAKYAFFGNLRMSHLVGMVRDIEIARSDQVLFESDMTAVRGIMHLDIQEADASAIVTGITHA